MAKSKAQKLRRCFHIDIVEADSKEPFPRHSKNGIIYIEVEPDTEYFVIVKKIKELPTTEKVCIQVFVNGQSFGWAPSFHDRKDYLFGLCKYRDGKYSEKALRFQKPQIQNETNGSTDDSPLMGKIEAKIYQYLGTKPSTGHTNVTLKTSANGKVTRTDSEKLVTTEEGSIENETSSTGTTILGRELSSLFVNYCTVPELMRVGLFSQSKKDCQHNRIVLQHKKKKAKLSNDHDRASNGGTDSNGSSGDGGNAVQTGLSTNERNITTTTIIQPQTMVTTKIVRPKDGGEAIQTEEEFDMFDLTHLPSSDSEGDDDDDDDRKKKDHVDDDKSKILTKDDGSAKRKED